MRYYNPNIPDAPWIGMHREDWEEKQGYYDDDDSDYEEDENEEELD